MTFGVKGKNAIVTGAYQGIGKSIALKLASHGVNVLLVDLNPGIHSIVTEEQHQVEGQLFSFVTDLTNSENITNLVEFAKENFQVIDILVNNAGIMQTKPFLDITEEDWDRVLSINLKSVFLLSQAIVAQMLTQKEGRIINISSIAGRSGRPYSPHYAASKAGIISLTKSMAEAFGKQNIRTNAICPGVILTPMMEEIYENRSKLGESPEEKFLQTIKLDRLGTPEDVSDTALFLCSDQSSYINGQALNVCGGYEMD
ncbi:glucose 1-dehydrogenase [Sporosarcina sp. 179-K 3D1 HS]|uniref:SDR family NAD(P)-dependent oxidoreductase n=1 Tax=Sporosarcina sp. 179-K 3D1 HS TaxID=3232169 RepID=UPI0039A3741E